MKLKLDMNFRKGRRRILKNLTKNNILVYCDGKLVDRLPCLPIGEQPGVLNGSTGQGGFISITTSDGELLKDFINHKKYIRGVCNVPVEEPEVICLVERDIIMTLPNRIDFLVPVSNHSTSVMHGLYRELK